MVYTIALENVHIVIYLVSFFFIFFVIFFISTPPVEINFSIVVRASVVK